MKKPIKVWHELRALRFSPADAEAIAKTFKRLTEDERDHSVSYVASAVCAKHGLSPVIWHEPLVRAFADAKELIKA